VTRVWLSMKVLLSGYSRWMPSPAFLLAGMKSRWAPVGVLSPVAQFSSIVELLEVDVWL